MFENEMKKGHKPPGTPAKKAKKLFIQEMNTKAQQIGLTRSRFVEPAGFPSTTEQVMSTRDMLKLMIYASRYQELAAIWNKKIYAMKIHGREARELTVQTTVRLPQIEAEYEILGAKTGAIWGTNEMDGFHIVLLFAAPDGKKYAAALRGAASPAKRARDLKIAMDNALILEKNPKAKVQDIESESAAVCRLPDQSEFNPKADLPLIFSKNADVPGHPASVTKLMTAVTALDYVSGLEEQFMIQETDITPGMGDYFLPGDILTLKDLLYGMMLPSSNTCAAAMARIAGEKIAARLN